MAFSSLIADIIPANAAHIGGTQDTIDLIVVHGTVSACVPGGARGNAHYFGTADAGGAAHYVQDPAEAIGCVDENRVAHHAPPNTGSVGVEFTDWQGAGPDGDVDLWGDQDHQSMLRRGANLIRDIGQRKGVALEWRTTDDLVAGRRNGITSHLCVAQAYHRTTHTDPGKYFPIDTFMSLVTGAPSVEAEVAQEPVFIAEFMDFPGKLWLVESKPVVRPGQAEDDPTGRFGVRTWIPSPSVLWWLAGGGIPVRSGKLTGGGLYTEIH
jgi:hypothetical protein